MMKIFSRIFSWEGAPALPVPGDSGVSSELSHIDIEHYYSCVVEDCLRRMLVSMDSIRVEVERCGVGREGLSAFAAYVRILKWDPVVTPVVLQNMSVIDACIRKVVNASFILEHTDFTGIWFQATSNTDGAPKALLGLPCELVHRPATGSDVPAPG